MFYVCDKKDNRFGVLDTDDGICEYYTESELHDLAKQTQYWGYHLIRLRLYQKSKY